MRAFVQRHGLAFPHVADVSGEVWAQLGVRGQPAWIFIDDDGTPTMVLGELGGSALNVRLDDLVSG